MLLNLKEIKTLEKDQKKMGVLLSYVTLALSTVTGIVYVPLYLHYMGQSEYGLYQLMGSIISVFVIMDFGLPSTIIRFYSKYKALDDRENMENILAMCSRIYVVITLAILSVGAVLYFSLDSWYAASLTSAELINAKKIYIVLLVNIAITLPTHIFTAIVTSYERFVFLKLLSIFQIVLQFILVIAVMSVSPTALSLSIVVTFVNAVAILLKIYYSFIKLKVKIKLHYFDKALFASIMKFSFFIFLNVILDQIIWRANPIILGSVASTAAVAVYTTAFQIVNNYMAISNVVSNVFLPSVTSMITKRAPDKELSDLFIRIGRLQFILLALVLTGFTLFGRQFVLIWAGEGFLDSYFITLIFIIPYTVDLIQNIGLVILQAKNKFAFRALVFLAIAMTSVFLAVPAAKHFGGIGCAVVTGSVFFIGDVFIMNFYYKKYVNIDIKLFWIEMSKIAVPAAICCAVGVLLNYFTMFGSIVNLLIKIVLYVLIYSAVMWKFAMNQYEKDLIKNPIMKILKKSKA